MAVMLALGVSACGGGGSNSSNTSGASGFTVPAPGASLSGLTNTAASSRRSEPRKIMQ